MALDPHDREPAEDPEKMDDAEEAQEEAARQREEEGATNSVHRGGKRLAPLFGIESARGRKGPSRGAGRGSRRPARTRNAAALGIRHLPASATWAVESGARLRQRPSLSRRRRRPRRPCRAAKALGRRRAKRRSAESASDHLWTASGSPYRINGVALTRVPPRRFSDMQRRHEGQPDIGLRRARRH